MVSSITDAGRKAESEEQDSQHHSHPEARRCHTIDAREFDREHRPLDQPGPIAGSELPAVGSVCAQHPAEVRLTIDPRLHAARHAEAPRSLRNDLPPQVALSE